MESYKREFIQFLEGAGVLKFGDFTAKSGRKIPYFINAGDIKTGEQICKLGEFYAKAYFDKIGNKKTVLYGPAYKGIPLTVATTVAIAEEFDEDIVEDADEEIEEEKEEEVIDTRKCDSKVLSRSYPTPTLACYTIFSSHSFSRNPVST